MSSFDELLEVYNESKGIDNSTFEDISVCIESLTQFVNEDVDFSVSISLEECAEGVITEADKKFGEAISKGFKGLIQKLKDFIGRIGEALKRFVAKAKVTIAKGGNAAISMIIKTNGAVIGKDITLIKPKKKGIVEDGFKAAIDACGKIYARINSNISVIDKALQDNNGNVNFASLRLDAGDAKLVDTAINVLGKGFDTSDAVEKYKVRAAEHKSVKDMYEDHVKVWNDIVKDNLGDIEGTCKEAQKTANVLVKKLSGIDTSTDAGKLTAKMSSEVSAISSKMMQLSTYTLNFAFKVLTMSTKNAAKIAVAAVGPTGKALASGAKGAVKDKVDDAKYAAASAANDNKSAKQSASAFGATKKQDQKVQKRSDVVREK